MRRRSCISPVTPNRGAFRAENVSFNFKQVMARKDLLVKGFADYRHEQLRSGKFEFIRAMASFADAHTLEIPPLWIR